MGFRCWAFRIEIWAAKDTLLFLVYERLDFESPNRSPSMAKRLPQCKPESAKPGDRESRRKKTSSQAAVPGDLAGNTSNALEALLFTVGFEIFDRYGLLPINRRGPMPLHAHCHFQPRFSLVIFSARCFCFCLLRIASAEAPVDSRG
jgi:hypothetical protein